MIDDVETSQAVMLLSLVVQLLQSFASLKKKIKPAVAWWYNGGCKPEAIFSLPTTLTQVKLQTLEFFTC